MVATLLFKVVSPIHCFHQCINEEGFRLFLKTYLEVEDFPVALCQRLFLSFQNSEPTQEDSPSEITHNTTLYQALINQHQCSAGVVLLVTPVFLLPVSCRGFSEGCFLLLLSPGGRPAPGQAGV